MDNTPTAQQRPWAGGQQSPSERGDQSMPGQNDHLGWEVRSSLWQEGWMETTFAKPGDQRGEEAEEPQPFGPLL